MPERTLVAMSGGVDSTAAALLLADDGRDVAGLTLLLHDLPSARAAVSDAQAAARALGIPHSTLDARALFRRQVMDEFAAAYAAGLTPNPCALCNRTVKLPALLDAAGRAGFDRAATGHYAQISYEKGADRWILRKGLDFFKDQSYFLYRLSQEQLSRLLFPLGSMTKAQVKELAAARGLVSAARPESQDVCFIPPEGDYRDFLRREYGLAPAPGDFVDESGAVLGRHQGTLGYTVGQRRGLGVSAESRLYVLATDPASNRVVLGPESSLLTRRVLVKNINPVSVPGFVSDLDAEVKLRYSRGSLPARVHVAGPDALLLEFSDPVRRPAPGQSAVLYEGDVVLGGGEISNEVVM